MIFEVKPQYVIENLIKYTDDDLLSWDRREEDDPFYSYDKEEYTVAYPIGQKKTIDILLTKHNFYTSNNMYIHFYFNDLNNTRLHREMAGYYYQNYSNIFELFISVKYGNWLRKEEIVDYIIDNLDDYNWKTRGTFFMAVLEKSPKGEKSALISVYESGVVEITIGNDLIVPIYDRRLLDALME